MCSKVEIKVSMSPQTVRVTRSAETCCRTAARVSSEMLRTPFAIQKLFRASNSSCESLNVTSLFLLENRVIEISPAPPGLTGPETQVAV